MMAVEKGQRATGRITAANERRAMGRGIRPTGSKQGVCRGVQWQPVEGCEVRCYMVRATREDDLGSRVLKIYWEPKCGNGRSL